MQALVAIATYNLTRRPKLMGLSLDAKILSFCYLKPKDDLLIFCVLR